MELKDALQEENWYYRFRKTLMQRKYGRLPTVEEFANFCDPEFIYLRVSAISDTTSEEMARQITKLRKNYRRDNRSTRVAHGDRYYRLTGRIRYDELTRYLDVFDKREKGVKMKDIISGRAEQKKIETAMRECPNDFVLAKKIIKNVEEGIFPGLHESRK